MNRAYIWLICLNLTLVVAISEGDQLPTTSITRCCESGKVLIHSWCKAINETEQRWPPLVFDDSGNKLDVKQIKLIEEVKPRSCNERQFNVTSLFKLYVNGSIITDDGYMLAPGEFCLNPTLDDDTIVAQYCTSDPCDRGKCLKKCCPKGMIFVDVDDESSCRWATGDGKHDVLSSKLEGGHNSSLVTRYGAVPSCRNKKLFISQEFYVSANGSLIEEATDGKTVAYDEYCVESSVTQSNALDHDVIALLCGTPDENSMFGFYPYLLFTSALFLIATFVVYAILPGIRNVHGLTVMCHVASMAVTYIGLGLIQLSVDATNDTSCTCQAVVTHLAFLSSFTWLSVMCLDIWLTLKKVTRTRIVYGQQAFGRRFLFYSIYAWGVPLVIVSTGQIMQHFKDLGAELIAPSFGDPSCWFTPSVSGPYWAYLYGPIAALIFANIVFFILALRIYYKGSSDSMFNGNRERSRQKLRITLSLFFLMGVSWVMEVVSFAVGGSPYIWMPFDVLNMLIGVFVFVIFICKPNVWKLLKKRFPALARFDVCCPSFVTRSNVTIIKSSNNSTSKNSNTKVTRSEEQTTQSN